MSQFGKKQSQTRLFFVEFFKSLCYTCLNNYVKRVYLELKHRVEEQGYPEADELLLDIFNFITKDLL
ncbi:MAG: hypothetical protein IKJ93_02440 [Clostridia bacterium]|nr:hypothetical protein [Clostridia bacterium]